jgi:hypothetical protein
VAERDGNPGEHEGRGYAAAVLLAIMAILTLIALPFVPLLLALLEGATLGTRRVEDFCTQIGIHDELTALYQTVLPFIK